MRELIEGKVIVKSGTIRTSRNFQTASWWEKLELDEGEYEFKVDRPGGYMYWASVPGTIIEDYFASSFGGASVQSYDRKKNEGRRSTYSVFRYDYQLKDEPVVTLEGES